MHSCVDAAGTNGITFTMTKRARLSRAVCAFAIVLSLMAASIAAAAEEVRFSGEIRIGATFPLTGYLESYGLSALLGANTRVRLINAAGGINGKRLTLLWRDNRSEPNQAVRDVEELVKEFDVPAVIGPLLSDSAMAVRPLAEELQVVVITPMAAVDAATHDNKWVFRSCFTNSAQADGLIRFQMESYGAKTCAILFDSRHSFSVELADIFEHKFREAGGTVLGKRHFSNRNNIKDYNTPLSELIALNPDFIFAPCYAIEGSEIVQAMRNLKSSIRLCGAHTWDIELLFDASGSRLAGTAFTSALFEQAFGYRPFQTFFNAMEQAGMDNPDAMAACAYDAVSMLAAGLEKGETSEMIRDGLLGIRRMSLATGRVTISPEGDPIKPVIIRVAEILNGRLVPVFAARYDP